MEKAKINLIGLVATKTQEELQEYLNNYSNKQEKALAYLVYGLTWNCLANLINTKYDLIPKEEFLEELKKEN